MEKILAIIVAVLVIWVMLPHAKRGEFLAPNPLPPNTWITNYSQDSYTQASSSPEEGFGFRRFDFWNGVSNDSRSAVTEDFEFRY